MTYRKATINELQKVADEELQMFTEPKLRMNKDP